MAGAVMVGAVALGALLPAGALADWTTYRADAARSGVDSSSVGSLPFAPSWSSASLSGTIYAEPLVYHGLVIVVTESNEVAALSEATGQLVWKASAGTPVNASSLPCGDISPTVGITSTPVIDPATGRLFVVADDLVGGSIIHEMYAFNAATGAPLEGFPASVEPPGDTPAAQLQRASLALDGSEVVVGYGGNSGDCSTYHGWLVAEPETGGAPTASFSTPSTESAIWGAGDGPAVDASGNVWAATGNGNARTFGDQESVLELSPSLGLEGLWAPSNWSALDSGDQDLSTSSPALLPGGLVFQVGKQGTGYLLNSAALGGAGAAPLFQAQVCSSFGGDAVDGSTLYVACSDGVRAVTVNTSAHSFSILWHGPTSAQGPPIVAGGLVWVTNYAAATLLGLNPQTGAVVVTQRTPAMEHFSIPSASDGKLFLATGQTVQAYTIANPAPANSAPGAPTAAPSPPAPAPTSAAPAPTNPPQAVSGIGCELKLRSARVLVRDRGRDRRHQSGHSNPVPFGTLALRATCHRGVRVTLSGKITERLGKRRKLTSKLEPIRATLRANHARTLRVRVPAPVVRALRRHRRETGTFTLTTRLASAMAASGATTARRATVHARLRI
jgi:outer membrane protein assembly factor BamB